MSLTRTQRLAAWLVGGAAFVVVAYALDLPSARATAKAFTRAESALRSGLIVLVWVGFSVLVGRFVANRLARTGLLLVPVGLYAAFVLVPSIVTSTGDDGRATADIVDASEAATGNAKAPQPSAEPPPSAPVTSSSSTSSTTTTSTAPPQPVRVSTGALRPLDYDAGGAASIIREVDGRHTLRLEDFFVDPGPDYGVFMVRGTDKRSPGDGFKVANLRNDRGNDTYDLPADFDPADPWTVLIWCQGIASPVANATQAPA